MIGYHVSADHTECIADILKCKTHDDCKCSECQKQWHLSEDALTCIADIPFCYDHHDSLCDKCFDGWIIT